MESYQPFSIFVLKPLEVFLSRQHPSSTGSEARRLRVPRDGLGGSKDEGRAKGKAPGTHRGKKERKGLQLLQLPWCPALSERLHLREVSRRPADCIATELLRGGEGAPGRFSHELEDSAAGTAAKAEHRANVRGTARPAGTRCPPQAPASGQHLCRQPHMQGGCDHAAVLLSPSPRPSPPSVFWLRQLHEVLHEDPFHIWNLG